MSTSRNLTAIYTSSAIVAATLVAAFVYKRKTQGQVERKWSFTSKAMAIGSFPPETDNPDPVISTVLLFHNECPRREEVVDQIVSKMLKYDRLSHVYDSKTGQVTSCENFDPQDLVRVLRFGGNEKDLYNLVEKNVHHPLSEGIRGQALPWWEFLILENTSKKGPSAVVWEISPRPG